MLLLQMFGWRPAAQAAELHYSAPSACPPSEELLFRINRALDKPLSDAAPSTFEVEVHAASSGYAGTLRVDGGGDGPQGERKLSAADCSQLVDALSLAIVLAIGEIETANMAAHARSDPDGLPPTVETSSPVQSELPAASSTIDRAAAEDASARDPNGRARPGVSLWMIGDIGSLPAPAFGVGLGAQLSFSSLYLRALGGVLLEQHVDLPSASSIAPGADLSLVFGNASVCHAPDRAKFGRFALAGCLGWEMGRMTGRGTGVRASRTRRALWLAPSVGLEGHWALWGPSLRLDLQLSVALPLNQNEFFLSDIGDVHRPSNLVGRGAMGVSWDRFHQCVRRFLVSDLGFARRSRTHYVPSES
jgi:hypothetical protein